MALKSTVFKAQLTVADLDRGYYADHGLTLARHPSETDERMMVRLLAFALHAHPDLEFGRGLSNAEEAALWQRDPTGAIELWIEVGLPDVKALRKAAGRSPRVVVYAYGGRPVGVWWEQNQNELARISGLEVYEIPESATETLAGWVEGRLDVTCTIQDGVIHLATPSELFELTIETRKGAGGGGR